MAKYASKGESSSTTYDKSLQTAISHLQDTDAAGIAYQKILSSFVAERDISGQETCHILLGCKLIHSSRQTQSLCVAPDASERLDFDRSSLTRIGIMERYKQRPHPAANVTLLEFATNWDWRGNRVVFEVPSHILNHPFSTFLKTALLGKKLIISTALTKIISIMTHSLHFLIMIMRMMSLTQSLFLEMLRRTIMQTG